MDNMSIFSDMNVWLQESYFLYLEPQPLASDDLIALLV